MTRRPMACEHAAMLRSRFLGMAALHLSLTAAVACGGGSSNATGGQGGEGTGATGTGATSTTGTTGGTGGTSTSTGGTGGTTTMTTGTGGTTPVGAGLFEAKEPWSTPVDQSPVDPASQGVIDWLSQNGGWGTGQMRIDFSITLLHADASTPIMPFEPTGDFYSPDCDEVPFPVPPGGAIEGESAYACESDGDCHLLVVDKAKGKLFEMWRAFAPPNSSVFYGGCSAVWDLKKAYPANLRGDGCTSADAGGFPIAAMIFTADEVAAGHIDHAIRFILPNSRIRGGDVYVHPGTHTTNATSGGANAPPYGVRFRLKKDFDLQKLPTEGARTVAKALQKYGMFLADGGQITLTAADDRFTTAKWDDANVDVNSFALTAIQVGDFEVVEMGTPIDYTGDCARNP